MKYEKIVIKPREHRIKLVLRKKGLDDIIMSSPENLHYVTGFAGRQHTVSRQPGFTLAVTSSDDRTAIQFTIMNYEELTFEKRVREQKERLREETSEFVARPYDTWVGVETWDEVTGAVKTVDKQSMESSFDTLKKVVRDTDLIHKKLGVELAYLNIPCFRQLQETFPETEFVDTPSVFVLVRSVKAGDEVQAFYTLRRTVGEGFYQVNRMVRPGVKERETADCFRRSVIAADFCILSSWSMFSTGPSGARLTLPENGTIENAHVVKYDTGANAEFNLYTTDTSRVWVMKDAAPELFRLKDRLYGGQRRMTATTRPGLLVCESFQTVYEYVEEQYPCHRKGHCGHSINLGPVTTEEPYISAPAEWLLEPGMILTMKVPCYTRGVNGLNIENMVLITEDGNEVLTPKTPHYLQGTNHFKTI